MAAEPRISSRSLRIGCVDPTGRSIRRARSGNGLFAPLTEMTIYNTIRKHTLKAFGRARLYHWALREREAP
jgi:hypothetical protein